MIAYPPIVTSFLGLTLFLKSCNFVGGMLPSKANDNYMTLSMDLFLPCMLVYVQL